MLLWCERSSLMRGNTMWNCKQPTRALLTVNVMWLIYLSSCLDFLHMMGSKLKLKANETFPSLELLLVRVFVTATEMRQEQTVKYNNSENLAFHPATAYSAVYLYHQSLGIPDGCCGCLAFIWVLRIQSLVFILVKQVLYPLTHLPSLLSIFFPPWPSRYSSDKKNLKLSI